MKSQWIAPVLGMFGLMGCASTSVGPGREPTALPAIANASSPIQVGETRIVNGHPRLRAFDAPAYPTQADQRVALQDGTYVNVWTAGSITSGRSALAQSFNADGSPRGPAVVISATDVDVLGAPRVTTTDGEHLVATFAEASETSIALVAVPLDIASADGRHGGSLAVNR